MARPHPLSVYHGYLVRVDLANQTTLAELRELDPARAEEWDRRFDVVWEKYADIASRLAEHEVFDPEGLELLGELDQEVGQPLFEDMRCELLQEVARRLGEASTGVSGVSYWSVGPDTAFVYHWCPNCWSGKLIIAKNRRGDPVHPEDYRECKNCWFLTKNRNCQ